MEQQSATGPYFLGEEFSLAGIAIAPFVLRIHAVNHDILDDYRPAALANARLLEFIKGVSTRASVKETYVGDEKFLELLSKKAGLTEQ